jgi:hypothetical protein
LVLNDVHADDSRRWTSGREIGRASAGARAKLDNEARLFSFDQAIQEIAIRIARVAALNESVLDRGHSGKLENSCEEGGRLGALSVKR